MERGQAGLGGGFDASTVLEQQLNHLDAVLLAGNVKRGEAVKSPRIGICFAVEKELGNSEKQKKRGSDQCQKCASLVLYSRAGL